MENPRLLFDTDILIDFLRGRPDAVEYVEGLHEPIWVSSVTIAELYAGVRDGREKVALDTFISKVHVVELSKEASIKGGLYRRDFGKSHGVGLSDALIAASAELASRSVVTFNAKHFPMLSSVVVPYQKT